MHEVNHTLFAFNSVMFDLGLRELMFVQLRGQNGWQQLRRRQWNDLVRRRGVCRL